MNVSLLGFPKDNDWILYAPYTDKSFLRDILAYKLYSEMGHYASRWKFCELFLYGKVSSNPSDTVAYKGIYLLLEKIKRDKDRVNVSKLLPQDSLASDITGGYVIKIDKNDGEQNAGWLSNFISYANRKIRFQYHYPKPEDINDPQKNYIQTFIRSFEAVMYSSDYTDSTYGYIKYIDVDSFIDMFIINELSKNVDGYRLSSFFYKDRDDKNSKLFAGPPWDYNLGFGNANYYDGESTNGWEIQFLTTDQNFLNGDSNIPPFWWRKLLSDPNFMNKLKLRWNSLRSSTLRIDKINSFIDSLAVVLDEAQKRNYSRWPILNEYVWPNPIQMINANTYPKQITYLKNWITTRIQWIDKQFFGIVLDTQDISNTPEYYSISHNYPNPFNPETRIKYELPVTSDVKMQVFDLTGRLVKTLLSEVQNAGRYNISWNGIDSKNNNVASGIYFLRMNTGSFIQTIKMMLIR